MDVNISPELKKEGVSRELVNRIQNIRKDSGLEVTDRIDIEILSQEDIDTAVSDNEQYIKEETLADSIRIVNSMDNGTKIEFDGMETSIGIIKK